ncbi:MAG: Ig-like domain-containing protein [Saprospiraceae bacterium]
MKIYLSIILGWLLVSCANIVAPIGGPKDEIPPHIDSLNSSIFFETQFEKKRIILTFDEFVRLDNPAQGILFSPPLDYRPSYSLKKRSLRIDFDEREILKNNTTYTINFGDAVVDLTERNPAEDLRYVFATGKVIDSLELTGKITYAATGKPVEGALMGLYQSINDSIILEQRPFYFSKTNKDGKVNLSNLKSDTFKVVGWKDENFNYKYDPYTEEFGFHPVPIVLESNWKDSLITLSFFKEIPPIKILNVSYEQYGIIIWKLNRNYDSIDLVIHPPDLTNYLIEQNADSVFLWYNSPSDSIQIVLTLNQEIKDTVKYAIPPLDSNFNSTNLTSNYPRSDYPIPIISEKPLFIKFDTPLGTFDTTKFQLTIDSLLVETPFWNYCQIDKGNFEIGLHIENENYHLAFLPGAFTDIFGRINQDTLAYQLKLESSEKYGTVSLSLDQLDSTSQYLVSILPANQPLPVFQTSVKSQTKTEILCDYLKPGQYFLQIALDLNQNNRWDTGNYFKRQQPEPLQVWEIPLIKANWEINFEVSLEK